MSIRFKPFFTLVLVISLVGIFACEKTAQTETPPADEPAQKTDTVKVAKAGAKIDPPVESSKIPDGAWMCDMGTVHYASMEAGDGKCPLCGMKLKQKEHKEGDGHKH